MVKVRINWGAAPEEKPVRMYEVYNTNYKTLLVLALDASTAHEIAYTANHVHRIFDRKNRFYPLVVEVKQPSDRRFAECSDGLQAAIARRVQGTVHLDDGYVAIGHDVIKP